MQPAPPTKDGEVIQPAPSTKDREVIQPAPSTTANTMVAHSSTPHPHFDAQDADLILRSSDEKPIDFRVYRQILSLTSEYWASSPHSPVPKLVFDAEEKPCSLAELPIEDRMPVIYMQETASVIEHLLLFLYPGETPSFGSLDALNEVMSAAHKYGMLPSLPSLRRCILSPFFLQRSPVRVYAIALRYNLREEAREASRHTLKINIFDDAPCKDLDHITGNNFRDLVQLHCQRSRSAVKLLDSNWKRTHCSDSSCSTWVNKFRDKARRALIAIPDECAIFEFQFILSIEGNMCGKPGCPTTSNLGELRTKMTSLKATI